MARISQNLLRLDGRYYYRQRIPLDLISTLKRKQFKKALGTACPRTARLMALKLRGVVECLFDDLRRMTGDKEQKDWDKIGLELSKEVIGLQNTLLKVKDVNHGLELKVKDLEKAKVEENVSNLIKQNAVTTEALSALAMGMQPQMAQQVPAVFKKAPLYSECMEKALADKLANGKPSEHTMNQTRTRMGIFIRVHEDKPIDEYTREDINEYKSWVERLPQSFGRSIYDKIKPIEILCKRPGPRLTEDTMGRHLDAVKLVFEAGSLECQVNMGILDRIKMRGEESKDRIPWTIDQLNELFRTPVWTGRKGRAFASTYHKGTRFYKDAWFWLPIMGLYTGMRLEEICKLRVCDFKDADGIPYMDVTTDFGRVKNRNSVRQVPIHPDLIRFGLYDLVEAAKGQKDGRVFYELKLAKREGKWGKFYTKKFGIYREKTIGTVRLRDFHAFRHNFASCMYDITRDIITTAHILGHSPADASDLAQLPNAKGQTTSYIHRDLKQSYEAMLQLKYVGLDLTCFHKNGPR